MNKPNPMRRYAGIAWTSADVQSLAPRLTDEEAEEFLRRNDKYITQATIEYGWECLATYLHMDGVDMSDPNDPQED